jgi:hypothetical protein
MKELCKGVAEEGKGFSSEEKAIFNESAKIVGQDKANEILKKAGLSLDALS